MGKANRRKREPAKRVPKQPDDAVSYGPIRIDRFGRFVRYRNDSTPDQHTEFLKKVKESHDSIKGDLEREVTGLQQLIDAL